MKHHKTYGKNYKRGYMAFTTGSDRDLALRIVHYMLMECNKPTDQLVDELEEALDVDRNEILKLAQHCWIWLMEDEIPQLSLHHVNVEKMDPIEGSWRQAEAERKGLI